MFFEYFGDIKLDCESKVSSYPETSKDYLELFYSVQ